MRMDGIGMELTGHLLLSALVLDVVSLCLFSEVFVDEVSNPLRILHMVVFFLYLAFL